MNRGASTLYSKSRTEQRVCHGKTHERGLAMLALLIALMLMSIALAGALDVWSLERQREQERQLMFVGNQYRLAILRYYRAGRSLPASVDDLLNDSRFPTPLHHLRRAYADPVAGNNDWVFMRQGEGIYGVYSSSAASTIKRAGFPQLYEDFENQTTYNGWRFFYFPPVVRNYTNTNATTVRGGQGKPAATFDPMNGQLPSFSPHGLSEGLR